MKHLVVLNACAPDWIDRAGELRAFLRRSPDLGAGHTLLFYRDPALREALLAQVGTASASLVRVADDQPETILAMLEQLAAQDGADLLCFADNRSGREWSVRLGCRLGGSALTGVQRIALDPDRPRCTRAAYSSHMEAEWALPRRPWCLSVARGEAAPAAPSGAPRLRADLDWTRAAPCPWIEASQTVPEAIPEGLQHAPLVLAVGMGIGSRERLERMAGVARTLGAELGVSRPVAMNAWAPMQRLIGVSGAMIRPRVCLVAGASGAPAFMAGVAHSDFLVALNSDPEAAILDCADVAVVGECLAIMEALAECVRDAAEGAP